MLEIITGSPVKLSYKFHSVAQTDQTEPLDLSISKVKEKGNALQGLSMERMGEEEIGLQLLQTKPLDLLASKVKEEGNKPQGLSVEGVANERIKPQQQLVTMETVEVMELSKKERRAEGSSIAIYVKRK
ncbi:Uncharacterized protein BM_BM17823 [Brugia malayi]|uniref:C2H2-type domain-containing protein n=1 Tax=Brugia malayi TaxID=6279 RepID=A0A4E9FTH8_BRUMA|nr:Uncharacterized protein BM_BM17823 [Brugia malayi]VIO99309.1 Uncharacterized protein BM_BM17823 [Brugia malayi]